MIDPSIALHVQPFQPPDMLGNASKFMQLQALASQSRQQGMEEQKLQRQIQDAEDVRQTLQKAQAQGIDPLKAVSALGSQAAQTYAQHIQQLRSGQVRLDADKFKLSTEHIAKVGNDLLAAANAPGATPQAVAARIQAHAQQGTLPPEQAQQMLQTLPADPAALRQWGILQGVQMGVAKDVLGLFMDKPELKDNGTAWQQFNTNPLTGEITAGKEVAQKSQMGDLQKWAASFPGGLNPDGTVNMENRWVKARVAKETHIAPAMTVQVGGGAPSASPEKRSSRAIQIANGEIPAVKPTRGDPTALRDMADAREIMLERGQDPNDLPGLYEGKRKGQTSWASGQVNAKTITALNTAVDHMGVLQQAGAALKNGDWQTANKITNAIGVNMGQDEKTNFDAVATFLAGEIEKVISGNNPTLEGTRNARAMFPAEGSNKQIAGAIQKANQILGGKLNALNLEHKGAFNGASLTDRKKLTPAAIAAFQGVLGDREAPKAGALTNLHSNGRQTIGWNGSKWVDQATGQEVK